MLRFGWTLRERRILKSSKVKKRREIHSAENAPKFGDIPVINMHDL